jgi:hypothetical protein
MTWAPPDPATRQAVHPPVWYVAACRVCQLEMPFISKAERGDWILVHRATTGHRIVRFSVVH